MILLEHEAKKILQQSHLPVPAGYTIPASNPKPQPDTHYPVVIKSQVPTGGRGKRGGIKLAADEAEFLKHSKIIATLPIKEFIPSTLLIEEAVDIKSELYLSLRIDRATESIELLAHKNGGIEVEDNDAASFLRISLHTQPTTAQAEELADFYGLSTHSFVLADILQNLYRCFVQNDATLIEINPLILTGPTAENPEGSLIAGDCKMTLDDAAAFRHPDWDFEAETVESNFVTLNQEGNVATIANGAGLAMATVDAVSAKGLTPANFLDIGGGASAESVLRAFEAIMEYPNVQAIVINIFAGITRCDEIAKAVITAKSQLSGLPPLFIRLAGTNYEAAKTLLDAEGVPLLPTLNDCLDAAKQEVSRA